MYGNDPQYLGITLVELNPNKIKAVNDIAKPIIEIMNDILEI